VYGIEKFKNKTGGNSTYKVEVFDHNRHYKVEYPHRHDFFYEVLYIKKGSGTYHIDFHAHPILPETMFFVSPGQVHEIHYSDDIYGYIFLFTEEFLTISVDENYATLFDSMTNKRAALQLKTVEQQAKFELIFKQAIADYDLSDKFSEQVCRNILCTILLNCLRIYETGNPVLHQKGKGAQLVKKFKKLIDEKYADYLAVKDFADLMAITPTHLNETVKQHTGMNANSLIDNKLLVEIKRLLAYTDKNISEIAFLFNFKDQSYFSRFFKSKSGFSPKEFRNLNK